MRPLITVLFLGITLSAVSQINRAEYYFDDADPAFGQGIPVTVPSNTGDVVIAEEISASSLSPGFHQLFFRVRNDVKGWSHPVMRVFYKSWPEQNVAGFRYRIDPKTGAEAWNYQVFPYPSTDVIMNLEINPGALPDGIHYLEASAKSETGVWSPISKGTFFSYFASPSKIKALEYYFEEEGGAAGPLLSVSNFTPSTHVTLDSVDFSVPVSSLVNLTKYYVWVRAVDENGNRGIYMKDTITYHAFITGIKDQIMLARELMVFPNPTSGMVSLKLINLDQPGDLYIKIFDETARIVLEETFSFTERDHYLLDVSDLGSGVFRIVIFTSAGRPVARASFIKN